MLNNEKEIKNREINADDNLSFSSHIGGWVYILKSRKDNDLYTGSTNDLKQRFIKHNKGLVPSTRNRRPLEVVYYEAYRSEEDARQREHNLKLRRNAFIQLKRRIKKSIEIN